MRFFDFNETVEGKWVGKQIQDYLVEQAFSNFKPKVERELFQRYRDHIIFVPQPDLANLENIF